MAASFCNADMRTGSPAFGTLEYTFGAQATGQLARRYGLPWRSSNVNASNVPDAQAAYESMMSLWGAMTGQAGVFNHGAGCLKAGWWRPTRNSSSIWKCSA